MLLPSAEQVGGVALTTGVAGGAVAAALLKEALGRDAQLPSLAITV